MSKKEERKVEEKRRVSHSCPAADSTAASQTQGNVATRAWRLAIIRKTKPEGVSRAWARDGFISSKFVPFPSYSE
ncbi:hypothetical protein CEXT_136371 [Caerostris extrusa]|uniref:Uncharacterized protein n=1 Tax=Caerostris extrusa TaxID=172846 RepID=A0AAV4U2B9_CAEEX|nr:hypothetical protein CEXT_136371 [Caerostris extrusa]